MSGTDDYDLPIGFAGFLDQYLSFTASDNRRWPVRETSVSQLLGMRQNATVTPNIQEFWFAKEAKATIGTTAQRFQILLFPAPTADGTLTGSYYVTADAMTDSFSYALGGAIHTETLLACCMAAAELERDKQPGPMRERYQERLQASISLDRRTGPKTFGLNLDRGSIGCDYTSDLRSGGVTYNGNLLSDL